MHSPLAVRWNLPSLAPSVPKFSGNVLTAAPVSTFIFTRANRFGLLKAPRSKNFPVKMSVRSCHKFLPNLHAIQPKSSHHCVHRNSSHHRTKNCPCKTCQWDTSVQSPVSENVSEQSFRDRIYQFSRLYLCTNLWHLRISFGFSVLSLLFSFANTRTMTCCVCIFCHCRCFCVA